MRPLLPLFGFCAAASFGFLSEEGATGLGRIQSAQLPEDLTLGVGLYNRLVNVGKTVDAFDSYLGDNQVIDRGTTKNDAYLFASDHTIGVSLAGGRFYQVNVAVPLYYQDLSMSGRELSGYFAGDVRVGFQLGSAFGKGKKPFAVGIQVGGNLPTSEPGSGPVPRRLDENPATDVPYANGSRAGGTDRGDLRTGLTLTADGTLCEKAMPLALTANLYTRTTSFLTSRDDDFYDILGWGALLEWRATEKFTTFIEYLHEGRVEESLPANTELNDLGLGMGYRFENGIGLVGGAAWGIYNDGTAATTFTNSDGTNPVDFRVKGTPDAQVYFAITWDGKVGNLDPDKDGIFGKLDKCPTQAEDQDGFEDSDGCPDTDNDKDGISDIQDSCPSQPEDMDGFQDQDGCPDMDNDGDGIMDAKDVCPNAAEDKDGFEDQDGCPDLDNDKDGVADNLDKCPAEPQGLNGKDGCPVRDADLDGIADDVDKCLTEKEVVNGYQDNDGCPDKAPIEEKTLVLKGVNFETAKAILTPESMPVIDDLAAQLQANTAIVLEVSGHTDTKGNAAKNQTLSQARAQTVADYLITKGVAKERLTVKGYGSDKPLASNKTAEGRLQNRRVEFNRIK
jgi:outer membrane protein OmpA-like peptidoglycan-associated protein